MKKITERKSKTPGQIIRQLADNLGYSRRDLAQITGMSYDNIAKIMKDQVSLTVEAALLLAVALETSAKELMKDAVEYEITKLSPKILDRLKTAEEERFMHKKWSEDEMYGGGMVFETEYLDESEVIDWIDPLGQPDEEADGLYDLDILLTKAYQDFTHAPQYKVIADRWERKTRMQSKYYDTPKYLEAGDIGEIAEYAVKNVGNPDWINLVVSKLFEKGIIFLAPKRPSHLSYHSGLFVTDDKYVIVFANPKDREDMFLYALLHQLGHIEPTPSDSHDGIIAAKHHFCGHARHVLNKDQHTLNLFEYYETDERMADGFIRKLLPISAIEEAGKRIGGDVDQVVKALPHIPEIIVVGYFRWFKSHYRQRKLGTMRRFCDVFDPSIQEAHHR